MRIRTVKPEFWSSPDTAACSDPWARLLFIALWNFADDEGRGPARPKELAGLAFPNDEEIGAAEVRRMLGGIRRAFGVVFYVVGGRPFYEIPSWESHQKIDKRSGGRWPASSAGEPWNPDPDDTSYNPLAGKTLDLDGSSAGPAEDPSNARRDPGAGTGEQGNRGTGEATTPSSADATDEERPPASPADLDPPPHRPDVEQLCAMIADHVEAQSGKRPNVTKRWRDSARLLLDSDLAKESDALGLAMRVAEWATHDQFWSTNILSTPTFREKFVQLRLKARREWEAAHNGTVRPINRTRSRDDKRAAVGAVMAEVFGPSPTPPPDLHSIPGGRS